MLSIFSGDRKSVEIYIAPDEYGKTDLVWNQSLNVGSNEKIASVAPGDFNGDKFIDLLLTVQTGTNKQVYSRFK